MDLLPDLFDALDRDPSSVNIHERLLEALKELGNEDMAYDIASTLLQIDLSNKIARRHLPVRQDGSGSEVTSPSYSAIGNHENINDEDLESAEKRLEEGYASLKLHAKLLREEIIAVHELRGILPDEEVVSSLQAIADGLVSTAVPTSQVPSVREVARAVMTTPKRCQELIVGDFEALVRWSTGQNPPSAPEAIREQLLKRKMLLEAALPESMEPFSAAALTHIERQFLQKKYVNSETMLGDSIADVPKPNFFVSEDNYAWDMDELAQAIAANEGVMRNPLSKKMFSESDIRMILAHPLGHRLKAVRMEQSQLKKGVRFATIDRVEKLGRVMLADQSSDAAPSREAIDEFLAYMATIPEAEQKTIDSLKIPARDGYSGQEFDYTIGESVRDAKANTTCFHKVGDFLSQAAPYLRRQ